MHTTNCIIIYGVNGWLVGWFISPVTHYYCNNREGQRESDTECMHTRLCKHYVKYIFTHREKQRKEALGSKGYRRYGKS